MKKDIFRKERHPLMCFKEQFRHGRVVQNVSAIMSCYILPLKKLDSLP
jgi:hypothetical protein